MRDRKLTGFGENGIKRSNVWMIQQNTELGCRENVIGLFIFKVFFFFLFS